MSAIVIERSGTTGKAAGKLRIGHKQLVAAGLVLAVVVGGIGYGRYWWETGRFIESTDDAYAGGNVTPVSPHVPGFIAEILVGDNQNVRAGQLLIRLDARDYEAALAHAQAVAEERQASLAGLDAKYVLQQAMIRQAEADLNAKTARAPSLPKTPFAIGTWPRPATVRGRMPSAPHPPIRKPRRSSNLPKPGSPLLGNS